MLFNLRLILISLFKKDYKYIFFSIFPIILIVVILFSYSFINNYLIINEINERFNEKEEYKSLFLENKNKNDLPLTLK